MKLFRVTLKNNEPWNGKAKKFSLYVIQETKDSAISYVNQHKVSWSEITAISELGYGLGERMFMGGKEKA